MYPKYKKKTIYMANNEQNLPEGRAAIVKQDRSDASLSYEQLKVTVVQLVMLLEGVTDAWMISPDSALGPWDGIVIEIDNEELFVLLINLDQEELKGYFELPAPVYNNRKLRKVPILVTNSNPWELLNELAQEIGLSIKDRILSGVKIIECLKKVEDEVVHSGLIKAGILRDLSRLHILKIVKGEYHIV